MYMNIPDFSRPSKDCFLTTDKKGTRLKAGDRITSNSIPLRGSKEERDDDYQPVEEWEGHLVIPHYGSFLLDEFVSGQCTITTKTKTK